MPQAPHGKTCVVCGLRDERALSTTALAGGERATVCGSHALIHERAKTRAHTLHELRTMAQDRRNRSRRGDGTEKGDELAAILAAAFAGERRRDDERRR
jgi:hypothetical protein